MWCEEAKAHQNSQKLVATECSRMEFRVIEMVVWSWTTRTWPPPVIEYALYILMILPIFELTLPAISQPFRFPECR